VSERGAADSKQTSEAADADLAEAYARLRRIAGRLMRDERAGHTLWPTEVVHEALARLYEADAQRPGAPSAPDAPRPVVDLITKAAHVMTQVLVDHARHRGARKRGGGRAAVSLDEIGDVEVAIEAPHFDWGAMDRALRVMQEQDPRRHAVVTLRFFGGLDNRRIARQLDVDERTVGREWAAARLWLRKRLGQYADE
jgi:RNA polymerase sigma factor (TIGR02999 family)